MDIARILRETLVDYYPEFTAKSLLVDINIIEHPVHIPADKGALARVFQNLLQNVCRYAGSELSVRMETQGSHAVIYFINDMEGMSEEAAARLFDRFYTADSSRNQGSTGLGLTIAKCLTEKMGGTLTAEKEGKYLKFILKL